MSIGGEIPLVLNLNEISNSKNLPAVIKLNIHRLIAETYIDPKEFLESISDIDLALMLDMTTSQNPVYASHAFLFGMIMVIASGEVDVTTDTVQKHVQQAWGYMAMESLSRKGLIQFFKDKVTFMPSNEVVCKSINDIPPAET